MQARAYILFCLLFLPCSAATVSKIIVTRSVDENSCSTPRVAAAFDTGDREAFVWFRTQRLSASDDLKVEWLAPDGSVALEAVYQDIPAASSLCFATRLPIAGFAAASQPGAWTVRIVSGGRNLGTSEFRIAGQTGTLRVTGVRRSSSPAGMELTID